jgi:hypothetical protein
MKRQNSCGPRLGKLVHQLPGVVTFAYDLCFRHMIDRWKDLSKAYNDRDKIALFVLVVKPDYLPDAEVLCFQPCLYPMKYFAPQKYVHSSTRGSAEGGYPLCGVRGVWGQAGPQRGFGGEAPKAKIAL